MSEQKGKIASGTGISCLGHGPASVAHHNAMVSAALAGHAAGHDDETMKAAIQKARADVKAQV